MGKISPKNKTVLLNLPEYLFIELETFTSQIITKHI